MGTLESWSPHCWTAGKFPSLGVSWVTQSCPTLCDSMDYIACQPPLSMDFPGKNTGVDSHFPLRGSSWPRDQKPRSSALQADSLLPKPPRKGNAGDLGSIPGSGRSPGEGNGYHSSILAWRIPWTKEPGRLQSMGLQRVRHDWAMNTVLYSRAKCAVIVLTLL